MSHIDDTCFTPYVSHLAICNNSTSLQMHVITTPCARYGHCRLKLMIDSRGDFAKFDHSRTRPQRNDPHHKLSPKLFDDKRACVAFPKPVECIRVVVLSAFSPLVLFRAVGKPQIAERMYEPIALQDAVEDVVGVPRALRDILIEPFLVP